MDSFEFELWIEQYKAIIKKTGERALFPDEMTRLDKNIGYMPKEYEEAYKLAIGGDYSKFEKLPHLLRNYLGAKALEKFRAEFGDIPSLMDEKVRQYLENNAMNAALRAGISAEKNAIPHRGDPADGKMITEKDAEETRKYAKALDSHMNGILMKRTMLPPSEEAKSRLSEQLTNQDQVEAAIERNKAKQLVIAKTMLLAQIGKYDVISKNGLSSELEVPVYETLVHGNRTNFVLPIGKSSQAVLNSFMGEQGGAAGIEKRTAATHSVKRRAIAKSGILSSAGKEERTYSPLKVFSNQFGMDIAAGGLGEFGPNKQVVLGKGDSGHMYMRAEAGDSKHCGSLLIGIEGSAPGADSFLGNEHGITAKSAKQSAFLADKAIVGKKVSGRQVDLSGISAEDLSDLLNTFSQKYADLQDGANTPDGLEKLANINDMLMGKHMNIKELLGFFEKLDMASEKTNSLLSQARKGYLSGVKANEVTRDRFEQSIRKGFSQEMACEIAEARFVQSTDLAHSVGAIKELMLTHETRSLVWKIRHPIKNYRENAKITDLTKRLKDEKGYNSIQIANEFVRESNSFEMDWGQSLSNDRDALGFERENKQHFQRAESMLQGVLKANYRDHIKNATPQNENSPKIKEELQKVFDERLRNREQFEVYEESEKNKITQKTSSPVVSQQLSNDKQKKI